MSAAGNCIEMSHRGIVDHKIQKGTILFSTGSNITILKL